MSDTPKRRWFQIHLSTAIVLMFVAGGMIGLYFCESKIVLGSKCQLWTARGWPLPATIIKFENCNPKNVPNDAQSIDKWLVGGVRGHRYLLDTRNLIVDLALYVVIIASAGLTAESITRRRKARKT